MTGIDAGSSDCPLVMVEWQDSAQPISSWIYLSDVPEPRIVECVSVGWLIQDGDVVKALAPNVGNLGDPDAAQASGVIRIPTRCITRLVRLREAVDATASCDAPSSHPGLEQSRQDS